MWFLQGIFSLALFLTVEALGTCSPKSCKIGLDSKKAACGSDGFSYYNRCHLELARCHNKNVTFVHRGSCRVQKTCVDYVRANHNNNFKPQCRSDGNYASGQCHPEIGYCWCVTSQGFPIPFSSLRHKPGTKHRCGRGKKTTRSSSKNRKPGRTCKREDKALFNSNLIDIFKSEWNREQPTKADISDKLVLDWKFGLMDLDRDDHLDKTEYRDLRRLVKKVVKPKRCAKSFAKACDMNRDQVIGRQEWAQCMTRDGMDDGRGGEDTGNVDEEEEDDDDGDDFMASSYRPSSILTGGSRPPINGHSTDEDSSEKKDDDATDCLSDRKTALDESTYQLYVPECTLDGRYAKVQCYKSAGYCWCVNEDTGKNIAGTAVKDQDPKCDQITSSSRPMKGCPEDKKITFLKDLMTYLHNSMIKETNGTSITGIGGSSRKSTIEEQVASWSFVFFDKNKNKVLDKNEWKGFKDTMVSVKTLKRCGKKLPRYCDTNKDRHISMTEWLDCLNTNRYQDQLDTSTVPTPSKLGKNPLSLLLDD